MSGLFVSSAFLAGFQPPSLPDDAKCFAIAYSESFGDTDETAGVGWIEDRTRLTDSPTVAAVWALALTGVADDGSNPRPLARITSFAVDPAESSIGEEEGDLPGEHVVMYVTADGEIYSRGDLEFTEIHDEVAEWPEIIKTMDTDATDPEAGG